MFVLDALKQETSRPPFKSIRTFRAAFQSGQLRPTASIKLRMCVFNVATFSKGVHIELVDGDTETNFDKVKEAGQGCVQVSPHRLEPIGYRTSRRLQLQSWACFRLPGCHQCDSVERFAPRNHQIAIPWVSVPIPSPLAHPCARSTLFFSSATYSSSKLQVFTENERRHKCRLNVFF